jgi:hypothetical protein
LGGGLDSFGGGLDGPLRDLPPAEIARAKPALELEAALDCLWLIADEEGPV